MTPVEPRIYDLFIDTGGFFAAFKTNDPDHVHAAASLADATARRLRLFTSSFALAETHALFLSRRGRRAALEFVQRLVRSTIAIERVTSDDEVEAIAILSRYSDKDFSYTDAVSFAVMRRFGVDVALAFDRHFVQFGFQQARG